MWHVFCAKERKKRLAFPGSKHLASTVLDLCTQWCDLHLGSDRRQPVTTALTYIHELHVSGASSSGSQVSMIENLGFNNWNLEFQSLKILGF